MKRRISIICSMLLITQAIIMPINAFANQTVEGVVKEEEVKDNVSVDDEGTNSENSQEEVDDDQEVGSSKDEIDNAKNDVTAEGDILEDSEEDVTAEDGMLEDTKEDNNKEDVTVEDDVLEEESSNIDSDITEDMGQDVLDGSEDDNLTYGGTIQIDGTYSDWRHIPHTDISWYSPDPDKVHQGALYLDGDILYGHYKMNDAYKSQMVVAYMELKINNSTNVGLTIQKGAGDNDIDWNFDMYNLPQGTTTGLGVFYNNYPKYFMGESAFTVHDSTHSTGDEVEFAIDLNVISKITNIPVESMREIELYNPNIGTESIVLAGSSSGAVLGVTFMAVIATGGALYLKRRKAKCEI